jgi:Right handed beta helix region
LKRNGIVFAVTLLAVLLASSVTYSTIQPAAATSSAPPSTCGTNTDSTSALQTWINSQPANSTLTMPSGACWNVDGTVTIRSTTGLRINANGSTFLQATAPTTSSPILQLWLDTNLAIENLNIHGALNQAGSDEGDYGIQMEADNGVLLSGISMNEIQGDFVYLSPPYDVDSTSDALNKNVWIIGSTLHNGGYHGLSIESVDGFVVDNDTFTNINEDAVDLEYDEYSTPFNADGTPYWAAQDNISILNSTWTNWNGSDWFVSDQGQGPGVQQQHVTVSGNTLNDNAPLFEIVGTATYIAPTTASLNTWLTITNNKLGAGFIGKAYRGGSSPVMSIYSVAGLDMENNNFPLCPTSAACGATATQYVMDLFNGTFDTIKNNNFSGALGIREPQTYDQQNAYVSQCGNTYGANGKQTDATCS